MSSVELFGRKANLAAGRWRGSAARTTGILQPCCVILMDREPLPHSHSELADMARKYWNENRRIGEARFLATMAVYEALIMPAWGMSVGEQIEQLRENQQGPWA